MSKPSKAKKTKAIDEMEVPEGYKLIEFDIDTTNPRRVLLTISCEDYDLQKDDLADAMEQCLYKLRPPIDRNRH